MTIRLMFRSSKNSKVSELDSDDKAATKERKKQAAAEVKERKKALAAEEKERKKLAKYAHPVQPNSMASCVVHCAGPEIIVTLATSLALFLIECVHSSMIQFHQPACIQYLLYGKLLCAITYRAMLNARCACIGLNHG